MVSVVDFGATGDGATDDREAIQAGIDSVAAAGGGDLFFPAGTYIASRSPGMTIAIALLSGVRLVGEGSASIVNTGQHHERCRRPSN